MPNQILLRGAVAWIVCSILTMTATLAGDSLGGYGTLKVGSAPIQCAVEFNGKALTKSEPVLTFTGVEARRYDVVFSGNGRSVTKSVVVRPGKVTFVFGNLTSPMTLKTVAETVPSPAPRTTAPAPTLQPLADEVTTPTRPVIAASAPTKTQAPRPAVRRAPIDPAAEEDAAIFFEFAEIFRTAMNPFAKAERYRRAERLYQRIIDRWPHTSYAEDAHFQLGHIYESLWYRDYRRAIEKYKDVLEHNFDTRHTVRYRIARLYSKLKDYDQAAEWYDLAAKHSPQDEVRYKATDLAEGIRDDRLEAELAREKLRQERIQAREEARIAAIQQEQAAVGSTSLESIEPATRE